MAMAKLNLWCTVMAFIVAFLALSQRYMDNTAWPYIFTKYNNFALEDIPDMYGKVVLVTGANSGLGYVSSLELARKGAQVIMACRSEKRAKAAMESILQEVETAKLEFVPLDLGNFQSTKHAVALIKEKWQKLDVVMANAGVEDPDFLRQDGMERPMRINHLGHFQLVTGLEELILAAKNPRVVVLSSTAHRIGGNVFDDSWYRGAKSSDSWLLWYKIFQTYGRSKLANILFARELQDRFDKLNKNVYVNSAHPGLVATPMSDRVVDSVDKWLFFGMSNVFLDVYERFVRFHWFTAEDGALTQLYLASSPEVVQKNLKGDYFIPHGVRTTPHRWARNRYMQRELWKWSEDELERLASEAESDAVPSTNTK